MNKPTKEGPVRQVTLYTGMIRDGLEQIDTSIAALRDNLTPVLREDLLATNSNGEKEAELVPFARELRDFHLKIEALLSTVNYMNEALEL